MGWRERSVGWEAGGQVRLMGAQAASLDPGPCW